MYPNLNSHYNLRSNGQLRLNIERKKYGYL